MRHALLVTLMLASATACWCAPLPDDAALDKPITLSVKGEALGDLMAMLGRQAEVRLQANREITDQKVTVFVDEKPLRVVMEGISKTFGYYWTAKKHATGTIYEVWQDEKSRQELLRQREKAISKAWQAALQEIMFKSEAAAMSAEDLANLKAAQRSGPDKDTAQNKARLSAIEQMERDPLQAVCARLLAGLPQTQRAMVRPGVSARFDARSSEAEWKLSKDIAEAAAESLNSVSAPPALANLPGSTRTENVELDLESVSISISVRAQGQFLQVTATVAGNGGSGMVLMPRIRQVQLSQQLIGSSMAAHGLPHTSDTAELTRKTGILPDDLARMSESYPSGKTPGVVLNRSDVLELLHRKAGIQIISDHYSHWTRWPFTAETTVLEFLDSLAPSDAARKLVLQPADWGWDGVFVYLRTRDVLAADSAETPNRLLRPWASLYKQKGCLGLDEHADIAVLSPDQTMVLGQFGQYLGLGDQIPLRSSETLQLFGALSTAQRREARSGVTSVDAFTSQQKAILARVFFRPGTAFFISSTPVGDPQVGIWTNDSPSVRLDKGQDAPELDRNPEPPVSLSVQEGPPPDMPSIGAGLPGGEFALSGPITGGPEPGATMRRFSSSDGRQYTMTFTFSDGRTQRMGFSIPKCSPAEGQPTTGGR